jgi:hypothetical protein
LNELFVFVFTTFPDGESPELAIDGAAFAVSKINLVEDRTGAGTAGGVAPNCTCDALRALSEFLPVLVLLLWRVFSPSRITYRSGTAIGELELMQPRDALLPLL